MALGIAATTCSLLFLLARDDKEVILPTGVEHYAPAPEQAEASFQQLVALSNYTFEFTELEQTPISTRIAEPDLEWLLAHEDAIKHNFNIFRQAVPDLRQLLKFDAIGDTTSSYANKLFKFTTLAEGIHSVCLYSQLAVAQGWGEKGLVELTLLDQILAKWLKHTRPQLHTLYTIAGLMELHATYMIIVPKLSSGDLAILTEGLARDIDFLGAVERSLYVEYCFAASELDKLLKDQGSLLKPLLFSRNETLNVYGQFLLEQIKLFKAQRWEAAAANQAELGQQLDQWRLFNAGGWKFLAIAIPATTFPARKATECARDRTELLHLIVSQNTPGF